jgi:hypothetical protein
MKLCSYEVSSATQPPNRLQTPVRPVFSLVVGLAGLEPAASSLSEIWAWACFPRITPATWANDAPLETVTNRSEPMGCGPNVDQSTLLVAVGWTVARLRAAWLLSV